MKIKDPQQNAQFIHTANKSLTTGEGLILMLWLMDSQSYICTNKELACRADVTPQFVGRAIKSMVKKNILIDCGFNYQYQTNTYEPNLSILSSNTSPTIEKKKKPSKIDLSVSCNKICEEVDNMTDEEAEKQARLYDDATGCSFSLDELNNLHMSTVALITNNK